MLFLCGVPCFISSNSLNRIHPQTELILQVLAEDMPLLLNFLFCVSFPFFIPHGPTIALRSYLLSIVLPQMCSKNVYWVSDVYQAPCWALRIPCEGRQMHIKPWCLQMFSPSSSSFPLSTALTCIFHCLTLSHGSLMLYSFCFFKLFCFLFSISNILLIPTRSFFISNMYYSFFSRSLI